MITNLAKEKREEKPLHINTKSCDHNAAARRRRLDQLSVRFCLAIGDLLLNRLIT